MRNDLDLIRHAGARVAATYRTRDRLALERQQEYRTRTVLVHTISVTVEWTPDLQRLDATMRVNGDVLKKDGTPGLQTASWTVWNHDPLPAEEQAVLDAALREFKRTYAPILPEHLQPGNEGTQP